MSSEVCQACSFRAVEPGRLFCDRCESVRASQRSELLAACQSKLQDLLAQREAALARDPIQHLIECYESEIQSEFEGTSMLEQKLTPAKAAREHLARSVPAKPLMHSSLASAADEEARLMVALESLRRKNPSLVHPDQAAVRKFASAMEAKMAVARSKGRSGWNNPAECSIDLLQDLLRGHLLKGDPVDVANFCMMLWNRGAKVVMP